VPSRQLKYSDPVSPVLPSIRGRHNHTLASSWRIFGIACLGLTLMTVNPRQVSAQVSCNWQTLHLVSGPGCTLLNPSAPNEGIWAWNPGTFAGISGDTHLWNSWRWSNQGRLDEFHDRDGGIFEHEFWKPNQDCGCNHFDDNASDLQLYKSSSVRILYMGEKEGMWQC